MSEPVLAVVMHGQHIADVHQGPNARLRLHYHEEWLSSPDATPLSLSLPLSTLEHGHNAISAYLWGLLPENPETLRHFGTTFGVSPRNPLELLTHMGEDCPGAVQFVKPDRVPDVLAANEGADEFVSLSEEEIAAELKRVRLIGVAATSREAPGRFSLAGAQPKTALYSRGGQWGRPLGRTPTTHILKPPTNGFEAFAENEHFCLSLARELGMNTVESEVRRFEDEVAIVVRRFDRLWEDGRTTRVHQEDFCQALGVPPTKKYENEGGPSARAIGELLLESSSDAATDVRRFADALLLNWVIAGTDAHAKNYSLLHAESRSVRFAQLYDLASWIPYDASGLKDVRLAMRVNREYRVLWVTGNDWRATASHFRIPGDEFIARALDLIGRLPDAASDVARRADDNGLTAPLIHRLTDRLRERAARCRRMLEYVEPA